MTKTNTRKARMVRVSDKETGGFGENRGTAYMMIDTDSEETWAMIHDHEAMRRFRCYYGPSGSDEEGRGDYYEFRMEYDVPSYKVKAFRAAFKAAKKDLNK